VGGYDPSFEFWSLSHCRAAYYNAGSAAIVLVLILAVLGTVLWCRIRGRRLHGLRLPITRNEEEHIPLTQNLAEDEDSLDNLGIRTRKGKERAQEAGLSPIFDVGDSDEGEHGR